MSHSFTELQSSRVTKLLPSGFNDCARLGYLLPHADARLTGDQSEVGPMASRLTIGQQRYLRAIEGLHERYAAGYADRTVVEFLPGGHPRRWRRRFRPRPDGIGMHGRHFDGH